MCDAERRGGAVRLWLAIVAVGIGLLVPVVGCGEDGGAEVRPAADTVTTDAVVAALEGTGYQFRYREVPHVEGYEMVAGEARQGETRMQFAVEVRLAGPYSEAGEERGNPQPQILRYGFGQHATVTGNIRYLTVSQAPRAARGGFELTSSKREQRMEVDVLVALAKLFPPRLIGV
ncbi:MAG TPA: hypothetical protein VFB52_04270 [Solirubrobacterales bacterium]|nr:hypothetical protein [Solirubrobacterales bacterium]